jgi:hypothetical protein
MRAIHVFAFGDHVMLCVTDLIWLRVSVSHHCPQAVSGDAESKMTQVTSIV